MNDTIKKQGLFIFSLIGIVIVSLVLVTTFAYQTLQVEYKENSKEDLNLKVGTLDVSFTSTRRINANNMPLLTDYKTADYTEFIINNEKSTEDTMYLIKLINLEYSNSLKSSDFKYTLVNVNNDNTLSIIGEGDFSELSTNEFELNTNYGKYVYIEKGQKQKIRLYLWLNETSENQNYLKKSYFKGMIELNSFFAADVTPKEFTKLKLYGTEEGFGKYSEETKQYIIDIKANPKNIYQTENINDINLNGITLTKRDNIFSLNGISNNKTSIDLPQVILENNSYDINIEILKGSINQNFKVDVYNNEKILMDTIEINNDTKKYMKTINNTSRGIYFVINSEINTNYDNYDFKININNVNTSKETISKRINLNEPLKCIDSKCDYIDFINNKIVRYIKNNQILKEPIETYINSTNLTDFVDKDILATDGIKNNTLEISYNK